MQLPKKHTTPKRKWVSSGDAGLVCFALNKQQKGLFAFTSTLKCAGCVDTEPNMCSMASSQSRHVHALHEFGHAVLLRYPVRYVINIPETIKCILWFRYPACVSRQALLLLRISVTRLLMFVSFRIGVHGLAFDPGQLHGVPRHCTDMS